MKHPKLRDSKKLQTFEPYPLNKFPEEVINEIGKHFIYLLCTGRADITGSDWGDAFAQAIKGRHLDSPIGVADVTLSNMAWSMKTVKSKTPFNARTVRLISGRCSPDYSYGIADPHKDIEKTGRAVLNIWNERINIAYDNYRKVRTTVLVRSNDLLQYRLFEEECHRYPTNKYKWELNGPNHARIYKLEEMEADHIIPWIQGGTTVSDNCQMLCRKCNREKGGK